MEVGIVRRDNSVTFRAPGVSFCSFNLQGAKVAVHNDVKFVGVANGVGFRSFEDVGDEAPHVWDQVIEDFLSAAGVTLHAIGLDLGLELTHGKNCGMTFSLWRHENVPQ